MALTGTSVIEINTSALAADTNGGAFDSTLAGSTGVDYTYGAGAQVVNVSVSGNGTATLTITSGSVSSTVLGNAINVPGQGVWIITAYTATTLTVNTTNGTPGTFASTASVIGGPLATPIQFASIAESGNIGYVGPGTYTVLSTISPNNVVLIGYNSNRTDFSSSPTIQAGTNLGSSNLITLGNGGLVGNFNLLANGYTVDSMVYSPSGGFTSNLYVSKSSNGIYECTAYKCFVTGCGSSFIGGASFECVSQNCMGTGFSGPATRCISLNDNTGSTSSCDNLTIVGSTGAGVQGNASRQINNTIVYGCVQNATYGVGSSTKFNNFAHGNNVNEFNGTVCPLSNINILLTADPFVNSGATINNWQDAFTNFALNNVAGGGALCRGAGTPANLDIGAVQSAATGGGGGLILPRGITRMVG